ncbi:MAG: DUF4129 domain-containing protein, partial [Armatimonadetes bacterium]|nr:DUF4129 domain-containing protein [Armatimonadota bacterium]
TPITEARSAAAWRRAAEESVALGNLPAAFGAYYLELLTRLDERGQLALDLSRTSRETAAAAPAELHGLLAELATLADGVFYGGQPATAAEVAKMAALANQVGSE